MCLNDYQFCKVTACDASEDFFFPLWYDPSVITKEY